VSPFSQARVRFGGRNARLSVRWGFRLLLLLLLLVRVLFGVCLGRTCCACRGGRLTGALACVLLYAGGDGALVVSRRGAWFRF
jgi:hypothetical protein